MWRDVICLQLFHYNIAPKHLKNISANVNVRLQDQVGVRKIETSLFLFIESKSTKHKPLQQRWDSFVQRHLNPFILMNHTCEQYHEVSDLMCFFKKEKLLFCR